MYTREQIQGITRNGQLVAPAGARAPRSADVLATTDGSRLFMFESGGLVQRTTDGRRIRAVPVSDIVDAVATRDRLVVSTGDGRVHTLDSNTLRDEGDLTPTGVVMTYLTASLDGSRIALLGADQTIRIADPTSRTFFGNPIGADPNDVVDHADFSAGDVLNGDGTQLAIGSGRGIVVLDLAPARLTTAACRIAGRNLTQAEWNRYVGSQSSYTTLCS